MDTASGTTSTNQKKKGPSVAKPQGPAGIGKKIKHKGSSRTSRAAWAGPACLALAACGATLLSKTEQGQKLFSRPAAQVASAVRRLFRQPEVVNGLVDVPVAEIGCTPEGVCTPRTITLFMNGEHEGGVEVTLTTEEYRDLPDIGLSLSKYFKCGTDQPLGWTPNDPNFCKVFNGVGRRVVSMGQVQDGERLYVVPFHRTFAWPTIEIGHKVTVPHVDTRTGKQVVLETLSHSPRVFRLYNFMDSVEADRIMEDALTETDDSFKLKRSSTGTSGYTIAKTRTSDNAFVTATDTALVLKHRIFELLGIEDYHESWADGLQVLRYNISQAYIAHLDYLESVPGEHDFDSGGWGTNRYATVVLYFTDVEEGGETVFVKAPPLNSPMIDMNTALNQIRATKGEYLASINITQGSWEERLLAQCHSRLTVKPKKGDAVLFYSQHPDGRVDAMSEHGACPVTKGQKWAANLWVWNGPRYGYTKKDPVTGRLVETYEADTAMPVHLTVLNEDVRGAELFYDGKLWDALPIGQSIAINSYVGHKWVVQVNGEIVKAWQVTRSEPKQTMIISQTTIGPGAPDPNQMQ